MFLFICFFFFFKQKTAYEMRISDWSSDVCSSDLDLNLAGLLVSPLFGWSQDDLFAAAHGRPGHLWSNVRDTSADIPPLAETRGRLGDILAMADFATPHQFFETQIGRASCRERVCQYV